MSDDRNRESDVPADLGHEREVLVRQFLRRGFEITESMLTENERLRDQLERMREENARLRAQLASDDAIRDLIRRIDALEVERRELLARSDELAESSRENERRSTEVEAELHDLANLYIASSHLHSTLSLKRVVRHLAELLQQLVGAERFAIFVTDPDGKRAQPLHAEGLGEVEPIEVGQGTVGLVMAMRLPRIEDQPHPAGSLETPVATVPMLVRDVCVGAIAVASVFPQKERWAAVDHEFLGLLGSHGGAALIAATLYADRFPEGAAPDPRLALRHIHEQLARQRDLADAGTDTGATDR
ncbi:MAG: GAF domain-containing protein [Sandaracinaceae bacterium]|nr:GAF domain-containing protein [Sandaracinaceae bacterium]